MVFRDVVFKDGCIEDAVAWDNYVLETGRAAYALKNYEADWFI